MSKKGSGTVMGALGVCEETLLLPLWARAQCSLRYTNFYHDERAVALLRGVETIYDCSMFERTLGAYHMLVLCARARQFERAVRRHMRTHRHRRMVVVELGAGLSTLAARIGPHRIGVHERLRWYAIDLPPAAAFRRKFVPDDDLAMIVAGSAFDAATYDRIPLEPPAAYLILAGGLFMYYDAASVARVVCALGRRFYNCTLRLVFDCPSRIGRWRGNLLMRARGEAPARALWRSDCGAILRALHRRPKAGVVSAVRSIWSGLPISARWRRALRLQIELEALLGTDRLVTVRWV